LYILNTAVINGIEAEQKEKTAHTRRPKSKEILFEYLHDMVSILLFFYITQKVLMWTLDTTFGFNSEFFQNKWQTFVDEMQDPRIIFIGCPLAVTLFFYWGWGLFFSILDMTGWLSKYKVQPGTNQPPDTKRFIKVISLIVAVAIFK
jgi:fatty acid hydroxylase domain-containing protein 2